MGRSFSPTSWLMEWELYQVLECNDSTTHLTPDWEGIIDSSGFRAESTVGPDANQTGNAQQVRWSGADSK